MGGIHIIDTNTSNLSAGSMVGSSASDSLLNSLKTKFQSTYNNVNDIFQKEKQLFVNNFVRPIRKAITTIKNVTRNYKHNDTIKPIIEKEHLLYIPPIMHEHILCYKPIYDLLKEERIFGFGYDIKDIRTDDPYERMINNGLVINADQKFKAGELVECVNLWKDDDEDLTYEEIDYIEDTRLFINKILFETDLDPTDYPNRRG